MTELDSNNSVILLFRHFSFLIKKAIDLKYFSKYFNQ